MRPNFRPVFVSHRDPHNFFSFHKHERNPFSLRISWTPPFLSRQTPFDPIRRAFPLCRTNKSGHDEGTSIDATCERPPPFRERKINYGRGGELFAGFVALSSLVTFNLLAGINLILFYSPRRPRSLRP